VSEQEYKLPQPENSRERSAEGEDQQLPASSSRPGTKILLPLLLIVVILTGFGYAIYATGRVENKDTPETVMKCMDSECGASLPMVLSVGEKPPLKCPKCGKKTLVQAYFCPRCKEPLVLNEMRGGSPPTTCPACGVEVSRGM
jgi:DNA-directed RNA polymerase subunit RPC12/RpoP